MTSAEHGDFRYLLTLTSFQPLYGKLSDIFGRKSALLSAYAIFGIGCLLCGLSRNIEQLIAARVIYRDIPEEDKLLDADVNQAFAGIGGGGMTTVVSILLSDIVPLRERGTFQGYINIIYATGAGVGAPLGEFTRTCVCLQSADFDLGGYLADSIGWQWQESSPKSTIEY